MTAENESLTLRGLLHGMVGRVAPADLSDLDVIVDAVAAAPGASRRSGRRQFDPTASASDFARDVLANICANLVSDVLLLVAGGFLVRAVIRARRVRWLGWLPRPRVDPDAALPRLPDAAVPDARRHIERGALARGLPADEAAALAETVIDLWRAGPA